MYLLDTDHISVLRRGGAGAIHLEMRLGAIPDTQIVTCIVVYEEQMRGWMAEAARMQSGTQHNNALRFSRYQSFHLL